MALRFWGMFLLQNSPNLNSLKMTKKVSHAKVMSDVLREKRLTNVMCNLDVIGWYYWVVSIVGWFQDLYYR